MYLTAANKGSKRDLGDVVHDSDVYVRMYTLMYTYNNVVKSCVFTSPFYYQFSFFCNQCYELQSLCQWFPIRVIWYFERFSIGCPCPLSNKKKCLILMFRAPQACGLRQLCSAWFFLRQSVPSLQFFNITKLFLGEWRRCFSCQIFVFLPQIGEISRSLYG